MPTVSAFLRVRNAGALLALSLALAACDGGGPSDIGRPLTVEVSGRLERGAVVTVSATADGAAIPADQLQLSFSPADAAEPAGAGKYRLLRVTKVTVSATAPGRVGSREITVAPPPVVVFDRMETGNRDLWRVDLDGQNLTRLTTHSAEDGDPSVARGRIVFISYRDGNGELYQMPLAGGPGTETRLSTTAGHESNPSVAPNGERVAYSYEAGGLSRIWVAAGNGTGAARLTPEGFGFSGSVEGAPSWAPASDRLVFTATALGTSDLFRVAPPGAPAAVTSGDAQDVEPAWSADGEWIVFTSTRSGPGTTDLYLLRVSTGAVTPLATTTATEYQPTWTPDGRVVYTQLAGGVTRLRWVDPADPSTTYPIETGTGSAQRAAAAAPLSN